MSEIGMSTSCFYPLETEKSLEKCCALGFKTVEMFMNAYSELDEPFISIYKRLVGEYSLRLVSIHTTASLADGYNYFSDYYRRFEESVEVFKKYIDLANILDSKYIVMHGMKKTMRACDEVYFERFAILTELAKKNGVSLLQENVVNYRSESPEYIERMRQYIGGDFGITLDIKQCRRAGRSPYEFIEKHHDIIRHIHISDYNDKHDCITPLNGDFDFEKLFGEMKKYSYEGDYIIELYKHSYSDDNEIRNAGIELHKILKRAE
ncbi:MAG: sugar phosphate isomerase/epimerase [Clostridiales bacterium]|nr:sugar phosphate isomerase/epimerase [Clostridiales bacterium]